VFDSYILTLRGHSNPGTPAKVLSLSSTEDFANKSLECYRGVVNPAPNIYLGGEHLLDYLSLFNVSAATAHVERPSSAS
jgi:hypothetical protein